MYQLSCLDPSYKVNVNNLQEETPIIKVQRTRYSQGLEFLKHQAEQKRIEKEQEHIDGSWEESLGTGRSTPVRGYTPHHIYVLVPGIQ